MTGAYEEIVQGETLLRVAPDSRHERICQRLHEQVAGVVGGLTSTHLLAVRSVVRLSPGSVLRPDLALITAATGKLWLAAEIIHAHDHRSDTVTKKHLYEEANLPRLWMIDARYNNIEIYHSSPYGLALKKILSNEELFDEPLLPGFCTTVKALFQA